MVLPPAPQSEPSVSHIGSAQVRLSIVAGPHAGEERVFDRHETLVVGRAPDAQWTLNKDSYFSRYHFCIECHPPDCKLIDLESSNGTFVNGQRVTEMMLRHGDEISCGDTRFVVAVRQAIAAANADPTDATSWGSSIETAEFRPAQSLVGKHFGDYYIDRELGRGAMGIVYHATHTPTGQEAALKLVLPTAEPRPEAQQLFLREASILTRLSHPRIVESREIGLHEGQMYLAMEYVPVFDFAALLPTLAVEIRVRVACGVICRILEALQYAHENDVVHRDVKPSNILVFRRQSRLSAKLADFGLAKNYVHAGFSCLSRENVVKGTLPYMAPEQILDSRCARPACDIYSAGACLYYYLADCTPFDVTDARSAVAKILNTSPVRLDERNAEIPAELAAAVARALSHAPEDRYSSAAHMSKAIFKFTRR